MVVYTWWCWHIYKGDEVGVDVDQLGKEKGSKLHRWSVRADSPMVPPAPYTEKIGFHRVHQMLVTQSPNARVLCLVSGSSEGAGVGLRPDAGWVRPVLLTWQHREEEKDRTLMLCPIMTDQMRPVMVEQLWELTGSDRMLESCVRS